MSRKFAIELDDKTYNELYEIYKESIKLISTDNKPTFEDFISDIITQYINIKQQANNIFGKTFKSMLDNFDPSQIDEMMKNMPDFFSMGKTNTNNSENKKEDDKKSPTPSKKKS